MDFIVAFLRSTLDSVRDLLPIAAVIAVFQLLVIGEPLPDLLQLLLTTKPPSRMLPSRWAHWIHSQLIKLGWLGPRKPSSLEYQQITQWYQLLAKLGRFDLILDEISFSAFIKLLRSETQQAIFQPQIPDSAVQILGPLEAAGLPFTHLWLMGLTDDRWPASPKPNPLLPAAFQQQMQKS